MANKLEILILIACFMIICPGKTLQQRKNIGSSYYSQPEEDKSVSKSSNEGGTHWKSVGIILLGVLILGAIFYGTNCLYLCQMTVCKGSERHYTKMDLTSQA